MSIIQKNRVDHVVYCTYNLSSGIEYIAQVTGVRPEIGGRHLTKGTHNAILKIGKKAYLEILAPDPKNEDIIGPRWMGIDLLTSPKITRWAVNSIAIGAESKILRSFRPQYGKLESGSRLLNGDQMLTWQLTDPLSLPEIDIIPFLIDWKGSPHPADRMQQKCSLIDINLKYPDPEQSNKLFTRLGLGIQAKDDPYPEIQISLDTPLGVVKI